MERKTKKNKLKIYFQVGTLAGNLSLKYAHNEFPSDIFLILEGCGAKLTIVDSTNTQTVVTPAEYLSLDMTKKCILQVTFPKLGTGYQFKSYKVIRKFLINRVQQFQQYIFLLWKKNSVQIMIRAQNTHAYVNAAFLVQIQGGLVTSARICFGGINPTFVHASNTESFLIGRNLFDEDTLQGALATLSTELVPDWVLPDASPEYRKNLALALFYRFALATSPIVMLSPRNISGGLQMMRLVSSGVQKYNTNKSEYPLTQPVEKYQGILQCSGEAKYVNDMPKMHNELWAAFAVAYEVTSTIAGIDPSKALVRLFMFKECFCSNHRIPISLCIYRLFREFVIFMERLIFQEQIILHLHRHSTTLSRQYLLQLEVKCFFTVSRSD